MGPVPPRLLHATARCAAHVPTVPPSLPPNTNHPHLTTHSLFDNDQLSLTVFLSASEGGPAHLILSSTSQNRTAGPWYSIRGAHELTPERSGSALILRRWSTSLSRLTSWATLFFQTWEEMVLFHCTFLSLKYYSPMGVEVLPSEVKLKSERRIFQAFVSYPPNHPWCFY